MGVIENERGHVTVLGAMPVLRVINVLHLDQEGAIFVSEGFTVSILLQDLLRVIPVLVIKGMPSLALNTVEVQCFVCFVE